MKWQERRDSNPQLTVLETVALPIELLSLTLFRAYFLLRKRIFNILNYETVKPRIFNWILGMINLD